VLSCYECLINRDPVEEETYTVLMTADAANNIPATTISWTNMPPVQRRRGAENVIRKGFIIVSSMS
jgi:hypothetical protein